MEKIIYLFSFLMIPVLLPAQTGNPVLNGYAWHQVTAGGVKPSVVAGEAGTRSKPVSYGRLYLYLEFMNGQNILPFRIWINGVPHRVTNEIKNYTPVVKERPGIANSSEYDTLVAATTNRVMQVSAASALKKLTIAPLDGVQSAAENGKIVVEYYWRARRYAYTFPEIKMLEAVRLQ